MHGMSTCSGQQLPQEKDYQITISENSETPTDNLSSSSSSSSTQGHDQSPDKPDLLPVKPDQSPDKPDLLPVKLEQLPDKPDQLPDKSDRLPVKPDQLPDKLDQLPDKPDEPDESLKRLPETNDSQKARMRDIEEGSFSRDMIVHSVQTVFQQWCTHSTLEYLGLPVTTGTETKATGKVSKHLHDVIRIVHLHNPTNTAIKAETFNLCQARENARTPSHDWF